VPFPFNKLSVYSGGMPQSPPVVLTIAGFDPSSGAGVTADIKTIAAHECYGISCITALTVQSTQGVRKVEAVHPDLVAATLDELISDTRPSAVHIGMLANEQLVNVVADRLATSQIQHIVVDPILRSTSGTDLLSAAGKQLLIEKLLPLAEVITPNTAEASALTGLSVNDLEEMRTAASYLHTLGAQNVVITGGDWEKTKAIDLLTFATFNGTETEVFKADRLRSNSTHGTGCAFSTAMACHLAHGRGLPEAVLLAKAYVSAAIANAYPVGHGIGPLHHLYRMYQQRRSGSVVTEREGSLA
jgi:hydroxymethylpyrimidine/phosphomethylpyrimidine kinase